MPKLKKTKRLGQHLLKDEDVANRIVDSAKIGPKDTVLEIGPGKGILTRRLVHRAQQIIAIEIDPIYHSHLAAQFKDESQLTLIQKDVLKFDFSEVGEKFKVISNLPYSVSVPIFLRLLDYSESITSMVLMFQKEVADRFLANPGSRSIGSLTHVSQNCCQIKLLLSVEKQSFRPVPKVDSSVLLFRPRPKPLVRVHDENFLFELIRAGFRHRRKTLRNNLVYFLKDRTNVEKVLEMEKIDPGCRAEHLGLKDFARLSERFLEMRSSLL